MTRRGGAAVLILLVAVSAVLCRHPAGRPASPELQGVYDEVRASGDADDALVEVEREHYLIVGIIDSTLNDLPTGRKRAAARDIAVRAYRRYRSPSALRFVVVAFIEQVRRLLVLPRLDTRDAFQFAVADLDPLAPRLTEGWERPSAPPHDLYIVPVGDVPAALMSSLVAGAEQTLGIPVTVLSLVSVERTMFDPARSQLIAEQLIAAVRTGHPTVARNPRARVIAVTAQDMYIKARTEWRFALSLRSNENSVAVVSYARMDPAYFGITPDEELLRSRLRKMIFKNIGMMYYSLPVSRDPRSVLYGNVLGLDDLDYMSEFFEPRS
jgi:predicted Zn-dependent protease